MKFYSFRNCTYFNILKPDFIKFTNSNWNTFESMAQPSSTYPITTFHCFQVANKPQYILTRVVYSVRQCKLPIFCASTYIYPTQTDARNWQWVLLFDVRSWEITLEWNIIRATTNEQSDISTYFHRVFASLPHDSWWCPAWDNLLPTTGTPHGLASVAEKIKMADSYSVWRLNAIWTWT